MDNLRDLDRLQAAVELVRLWRNLAQEIARTGDQRRFILYTGESLEKLISWTDDFLQHPTTPK